MKKGFIALSMLSLLGMFAGCSQPSEPSATATPASTATPAPTATEKPADIWNETTVFATLDELNEDTLLATSSGEQRTYQYDEEIQRQIELLEIEVGNRVAIHFEIDDAGNYVVTSIEKLMTGE